MRAGGCPAVVAHGRALAAQARGVLGLTPHDCQPFHIPLFLPPKSIYFHCEARCSEQYDLTSSSEYMQLIINFFIVLFYLHQSFEHVYTPSHPNVFG